MLKPKGILKNPLALELNGLEQILTERRILERNS